MPSFRFIFPVFLCLSFLQTASAQKTSKGPGPVDTIPNLSRVLRFVRTGSISDAKRVVINVVIREFIDQAPVMGATVLLRRENPVRMYGKVTGQQGACAMTISPDTYSVRVQVTGLASFEQSGFVLEPGSAYTLEIALAFAKKP